MIAAGAELLAGSVLAASWTGEGAATATGSVGVAGLAAETAGDFGVVAQPIIAIDIKTSMVVQKRGIYSVWTWVMRSLPAHAGTPSSIPIGCMQRLEKERRC
ncbi:MAG: hypothetical protein AB7E74_26650 [Pirellulales bacterium]